jgi:gamma-glutamyl hercynylcysteine S-oxide synthase
VTENNAHALRERAAAELLAARERTTLLTGAVDEADLVKQHSPLMSPLVWDLAHIANQEELWLLREVGGKTPMHPEIDPLYDAFEHPRATRPTLPLLPANEARRYGHEVRGRVLDILDRVHFDNGERLLDGAFAFGMVAQHEVQHDETMLATHQLRVGQPVLAAPPPPPAPADATALPAEVHLPGGPFTMGTSTEPWALDNERPAHEVHVPAFYLDTTPVTNAAYAEFIADGGYDDQRLWTSDGWAHRQRAGLTAPLFWHWDGEWVQASFGIAKPIIGNEPVLHVCWYEADAYARWAGRRLPTEAEWEKAARWDAATGRSRRYPWGDDEPTESRANLGQRHLRPAPAGAYPEGAAPSGARQLIGDVWEWTSSDFLPYQGFAAWPYKEYSEVFFGPEYKVLRGGAFGVSPVASRATFRNWDYPIRRQIFAGFRTARSDEAEDA